MLKLIEELQKDREARNVRPTYVPAQLLFTESIKRFGYNRHCGVEVMQLVRDGALIEHETIKCLAFSISGTDIKYNAEYRELI